MATRNSSGCVAFTSIRFIVLISPALGADPATGPQSVQRPARPRPGRAQAAAYGRPRGRAGVARRHCVGPPCGPESALQWNQSGRQKPEPHHDARSRIRTGRAGSCVGVVRQSGHHLQILSPAPFRVPGRAWEPASAPPAWEPDRDRFPVVGPGAGENRSPAAVRARDPHCVEAVWGRTASVLDYISVTGSHQLRGGTGMISDR